MSYTREMFESARTEIENRRISSENKAEQRRRDFEKKEPEYAVLRNTMISSVREAVKAINMKPEKAALFIEEQKEKNLSAQRRIKELLIKNNLPSDWLEVHYYCALLRHGFCRHEAVLVLHRPFKEKGIRRGRQKITA